MFCFVRAWVVHLSQLQIFVSLVDLFLSLFSGDSTDYNNRLRNNTKKFCKFLGKRRLSTKHCKLLTNEILEKNFHNLYTGIRRATNLFQEKSPTYPEIFLEASEEN